MSTLQKDIQKEISELWDEINCFLSNHNNKLAVLDFTTVIHHENGEVEVQSIYKHAIKSYPDLLEEYFSENGYSLPQKESDNKPSLYTTECKPSNKELNQPEDEIYEGREKTDIVELATWYDFMEKNKIAGSSWILFKKFDNNEGAEGSIEVGIYILLKNQIDSWRNDGKNKFSTSSNTSGGEINKFLLENAHKLIVENGIRFIFNKFKKVNRSLQKTQIERNHQRSLNHYLKPIFTGIGEKAKTIKNQVSQQKYLEAELSLKALGLQAEILQHHFQLRQDKHLPLNLDKHADGFYPISFKLFFKYLFVRNFFTGSNIDHNALANLDEDEYNKLNVFCCQPINSLFDSNFENLRGDIKNIFKKLSKTSQFKIVFKGNVSSLYINLPKNKAAMEIVIRFSSAFIENFKRHWMKSKTTKKNNREATYTLLIYTDGNRSIYFFQNKDTQGYVDHQIALSKKATQEENIRKYCKYFDNIELRSNKGLGISDIKKLLESNNINYRTYESNFSFCSRQEIVNKVNFESVDGKLFYQKLTIQGKSTLLIFKPQ
jgi:hypothetical protein